MPIGIGAGIIIGCTILGTIFAVITILFRVFPRKNNSGKPNNPNNPKSKERKVRYEDTCDEIVKRFEGAFDMLKEAMDKYTRWIDDQKLKVDHFVDQDKKTENVKAVND